MRLCAASVLSVVALLAVPAAAGAKGVERAQLCGAGKCFTFDRDNSGNKLSLFEASDGPAPPAPAGAPGYRLRITRSDGGPYPEAYVPSLGPPRPPLAGGPPAA